MSSSSNSSNTNNKEEGGEQQIESLLRQLHGQIKTSDWLAKNTADKLEEENPELIKAWKKAVDDDGDDKAN
jgi:hypothetical protein